jgi:hypothetical protein
MSSGLSSVLSSLRLGPGKSKTRELPLHQVRSSETQHDPRLLQPVALPDSNDKNIYLLLCYNQGQYAIRLFQLDLLNLQPKSDPDLFGILSAHYKDIRGGALGYFSLRTLTNIKFVLFEAHKGDLVDVRKQDDIPPPGHIDYHYLPAPPELVPPVGERYMVSYSTTFQFNY